MEILKKSGRMKLTLKIIESKFSEVLQKDISFEDVSVWAGKIIEMDELGKIEYDSHENISLMFSALTYLLGLNTEVSPNNYLYTIEDVKIEYIEFFGKS